MGLAALAVDALNEEPYLSLLGSGNFLERIPEGVLSDHAGFMPVDPDVSFDDRGFPARVFRSHYGTTPLRSRLDRERLHHSA